MTTEGRPVAAPDVETGVDAEAARLAEAWRSHYPPGRVAPGPPAHLAVVALVALVLALSVGLAGLGALIGFLDPDGMSSGFFALSGPLSLRFSGPAWGLLVVPLSGLTMAGALRFLAGRTSRLLAVSILAWAAISLVVDEALSTRLVNAIVLLVAAGALAYRSRYGEARAAEPRA